MDHKWLIIASTIMTLSLFYVTFPMTYGQVNQTQINNNSGYSTYSDPILQISIQYPSNYEVKEAPGGVLFSSQSLGELPSMDSPDFSLLEASLDVIDLSPEINTAQKFMRQMMNEQRKYDINILALNETSLSGNNTAYRSVYTTFDTSQAMDFFTVKDGVGYYLSFSVMPPERFPGYTSVMQKMSESFQILG
jgi:hypothetical protein